MRRLPLFLLVLALVPAGALTATAQTPAKLVDPAPGSKVAPAAALERMVGGFEYELIPAAKAMPADKYGFAPAPGTFAAGSPAKFETVRTFAQQIAHLAQANYYFFGAATGMKPDADVKAISSMTSKDDLLAALQKSFVFAHKAIATITEANAFEAIKPVDYQTTRFTVAAFAVAHGYDHYGQIVEYLRMNGIIPPSSAK